MLASAGFDETSLEKRPSVQVGDPFTEKLLIEASLELIERDLLVGLQDLGAGGISCPASEMAAKAGAGMDLSIDEVHLRESGMEPFEIMISESQERMLAVVEPHRVEEALAVCAHWGVPAAVVGQVTSSDRLEVQMDGEVIADVPARALADAAPLLDRDRQRPEWIDELQAAPNGGEAPDDLRGRGGQRPVLSRDLFEALDLGAVRPHDLPRNHRAPGGRRRGGAAPRPRDSPSRSAPMVRDVTAIWTPSKVPGWQWPSPPETSRPSARGRWRSPIASTSAIRRTPR